MRSRRVGIDLRALLTRASAVCALVAVASLPTVAASAAGPSASPVAGRSIAVSVPPDPVPFQPGKSGVVKMRVVNPGTTPVRVRVTGRGLTLGDEGKITINDGPDPMWGDRVQFPAGPLRIPAQGYRDLSVTVDPPSSLQPDLYFLGFVVTPLPDATTGVTLINQIGGFFTIDIPGPRDRRLTADVEFPGWSILGFHVFIGKNLDSTLHVHNVGQAAVQFWGETDTTTTGGSPGQLRIPKSLVPSSLERTFTVVTKPAWPIGFVHMSVSVVYPTTTETTTTEILFTRSVLVINPLAFVVLAVIVALVIWRRLRRRRRRGAHLRGGQLKSHSFASGNHRKPAHARRGG